VLTIAAIIFDLDNCLAPANEAGELFYQPAFDAIRQANNLHLSEPALDRAFADIWKHPLDWVAATHNFSEEMLAAGWEKFANLEVIQPLQGYGDLHILAELPVRRFLVTSGFRRLQESKIRALRIAPCFEKVIVDAIDEPGRVGKYGHFRQLLQDYALRPDEVIVVGDNAESEIAAGNQLGMRTIQTVRPGVQRAASASGHVCSLAELKMLL
jgi:FMN phosphatase YigB (HAD superfamily)